MIQGEVSARSIGKRMSALASSGDFPLQYSRKTKERVWCINRKAFIEYLENPTVEGEVDEFFPF